MGFLLLERRIGKEKYSGIPLKPPVPILLTSLRLIRVVGFCRIRQKKKGAKQLWGVTLYLVIISLGEKAHECPIIMHQM